MATKKKPVSNQTSEPTVNALDALNERIAALENALDIEQKLRANYYVYKINEMETELESLKVVAASQADTIADMAEKVNNQPTPDGYRPARLTLLNTLYGIPGNTDTNGDGFEGIEEAITAADSKGAQHPAEKIVVLPYWNYTPAEVENSEEGEE